ncbi:MAG TPA: hypothetical protein VHK65_06215 [Candidatus Dormibacteraeota bacterium]|nr:hypothetical protein [Candidatus Dormibacteraeota bacterium]
MKTKNIEETLAAASEVAVQGAVVRIREAALEAPKTAGLLGTVTGDDRLHLLATIAELGADQYILVRDSATVQLMEQKVSSLVQGLDHDLKEKLTATMTADREAARKEMSDAIQRFRDDLVRTMGKYVDPNSPEGILAVMAKRLDEITRAALLRMDTMLQDGDQGVLARQGDRIVRAIKDELDSLKRQIIEGEARAAIGVAKGRSFEEELTRVLASIVRPLGAEVVRCADHTGVRVRKHGDHLLTFSGPLTRGNAIKLVIEAKDREAANGRFSLDAVKVACRQACENRGASVCIFITDTPELLPEGRGFGTVDGHFFVAYNPELADDTALAATVHMALMQALAQATAGTDQVVDLQAARRDLSQLRKLVEEFDAIETAHSGAIKSIQKASATAASTRLAILNGIGKLDSIMAG